MIQHLDPHRHVPIHGMHSTGQAGLNCPLHNIFLSKQTLGNLEEGIHHG